MRHKTFKQPRCVTTWKKVLHAYECIVCPDCGEKYCRKCRTHYADCKCPGPHEDDIYRYKYINAQLHAKKLI
jgi:hypothetical protein